MVRMFPLHKRFSLLALLALLASPSCTRTADAPSGPAAPMAGQVAAPVSDEKVATPSQLALLELAFRVATSIPVEPHIKSRSRAQEGVLLACSEMGLHAKALAYAPRIDNWRRGVAHADLAIQLAKAGKGADARHHAGLALAIAGESMKAADAQEWRRDRVHAKVACAFLILGDGSKASELAQGIAESELAEYVATRAAACSGEDLDALQAAISRMVATGNLDVARAGMVAAVALVDRFHDDEREREAQLRFLEEQRAMVPAAMWLELQLRLAEDAVRRQQGARARVHLEGAAATLATNRWLDEDRIANLGRIAALRARSGDLAGARSAAALALGQYDAHEAAIVDIWRARAIRPVAEALARCGDLTEAAACYRRAIEAGVANPNSRPRAEDLAATSLSMALCGFEPDAVLTKRMEAVAAGLGAPW